MSRPRRASYRTTAVLCAVIVAFWLWDLAIGGGRGDWPGWVAALVLVGGISALAARGARQLPPDDPPDDPADEPAAATGPAGQGGERVAPVVRVPVPDELPGLIEVEVAADKLFEVAGYGATPGPATVEELAAAPLLLVAGDPAVGYVLVELVDGQAHIEGLSVRPRSMRRGIGSALVRAACDWAAEQGYHEVTLCTFADVPWNGPFYAGLGFEVVPDPSPALAAIRRHEVELGLDAMGPRVVMRRLLGAPVEGERTVSPRVSRAETLEQ